MYVLLVKFGLIALVTVFQNVCDKAVVGSNTKLETKNQMQEVKTMQNNTPTGVVNENQGLPQLQVSFDLQGETLLVKYKVKNTTAKAIYLFNILWEWDAKGNYVPASQAVYSSLRSENTLHLAKQIPPLPKLKEVEVRRIPFAAKIEAGAEFGEKIELPLPIAEYNPYFPKNQNSKEEIRTAESVFFTVQFIRESDELKVKPANFGEALFVRHPNLFGNLETLSSKPSAIRVSVKKRTDSFDEF